MARKNETVKAISFAIFLAVVITTLYYFNGVNNRLRKSEERGERLIQHHDSLAAQVQGTIIV